MRSEIRLGLTLFNIFPSFSLVYIDVFQTYTDVHNRLNKPKRFKM